MIELVWQNENAEGLYKLFADVSTLMIWLFKTISEEKHQKELKFAPYVHGYMCVWDTQLGCPCVLLYTNSLEKRNEDFIFNVLKNPPGEFKEKYVARYICEEPPAVVELSPETSSDDEEDMGKLDAAAAAENT